MASGTTLQTEPAIVAGRKNTPLQKVTIAGYLAAERLATMRHEYIEETVRAVSGGSYEHHLVSANITTALNLALEDQDFSVLSGDQRVYIEPAT